jgi:hypothetical protein
MTWCTLHTTSTTLSTSSRTPPSAGTLEGESTHPPPHAPEASLGGLGSPNPHAWNHDRWSSTCAGSNSSSLKVNALYCPGHEHQNNGISTSSRERPITNIRQGRALGCARNIEQELSAQLGRLFTLSIKFRDLTGISTYDVVWTCIRSHAVLVGLGEKRSGEKPLAISFMKLTGANGPANPSTAEIIVRAATTAFIFCSTFF